MRTSFINKGYALMACVCIALASLAMANEQPRSIESKVLNVGELMQSYDALVGTRVEVRGFLFAACKHGGRKGYIRDAQGAYDGYLRVNCVSDSCESFSQEMLGLTLKVTAVVMEKRIYAADLDQWEQEAKAELACENEDGHEHEGDCHSCPESDEASKVLDRVKTYREKLAKSGKDYLSSVWLDGISWEAEENAAQ